MVSSNSELLLATIGHIEDETHNERTVLDEADKEPVLSAQPSTDTIIVHHEEDAFAEKEAEDELPAAPQMSPSFMSILTRITQMSDEDLYQNLPICLMFVQESNSQIIEDNTFNFPPIIDPGIAAYMDQVDSDECTGWKKYVQECFKYSMPRLTPVKDVLELKTTELNLKNYCPQSIGIWLACEVIGEQKDLSLTHIDLSNSPFTESGCHTLGELLEQSNTLEFFSLANCNIGYAGIKVLEEGLRYMKCLQELDLSGCNLRDNGGVIVARAIRINDTVKKLNLSKNQLYSGTGKELGQMLIANDVLEDLELRWNSLYSTIDCLVPFFKGLKKNTKLVNLGLAWNGLTSPPEFGENLSKALGAHPTLQYLDLENNRLTGNADEIVTGLRKSKSLMQVKLGGNPWTPDDIDVIIGMFTKRPFLKNISLGDYKWLTKDQSSLIENIKKRNKNLVIKYQGTMMKNPPREVNFKNMLMDRVKFVAQKPKKAKLKKNIGHFFQILLDEEVEKCPMDDFLDKVKAFRAKVDAALIEQIAAEFQDPKTKKVYLLEMAQYYLDRHPTERLPPPPPPKPAKPAKDNKKDNTKNTKGKEKKGKENKPKKNKKK